jgi:hypothetical protein
MFATPSYFLFSAVAGFEPLTGDSLWRIAPAVVGASREVTSASATVWTVKGSLSSSWELRSSMPWRLVMSVTVPLGLRVEVAMPLPTQQLLPSIDSGGCDVSEAGQLVWHAGKFVAGVAGVTSAKQIDTLARGETITITLEAGSYELDMKSVVA